MDALELDLQSIERSIIIRNCAWLVKHKDSNWELGLGTPPLLAANILIEPFTQTLLSSGRVESGCKLNSLFTILDLTFGDWGLGIWTQAHVIILPFSLCCTIW